jgi:mannose-6-phosphate isomerase
MQIYRLENAIQPYAWGSKTAIAELLGLPAPHDRPQAELWMGTHAKGPSMAVVDGERIPIQQLIEAQPAEILGPEVARRFGAELPYLFKVLAAAMPLSIQAHPDKAQAASGFARENHAGIPLNASDRNYRDENHKPEVICALTPFWALNGFRPARMAAELLAPVCPRPLENALVELRKGHGTGIKTFFEAMMTLSAAKRPQAVGDILAQAERRMDRTPEYRWMVELARAYPTDMGVLSPALLNLIRLEPSQAMYLPAGQLHAYLDGVGIELMANSDNVLRGGLTAKHIDVGELLSVVRFAETVIDLIEATPAGPAETRYDCPADEFSLSVLRPEPSKRFRSAARRSIEILLCIAGNAVMEVDDREVMEVKQGDSVMVPAGLDPYTIQGQATLFKAAVPLPDRPSTAS